ncbi:hypothetical protein PAPYR_8316 [Paratrimastix pyriformis]|uniref:Uncharacterized protein n=1 Tax=Paratrimastix pyriformis TaxID=342808 RepID=A0ABQ8UE98_9EUKA|nr:hypothetical protein PAPYR_8316 [Paratrimastix pyriformis]
MTTTYAALRAATGPGAPSADLPPVRWPAPGPRVPPAREAPCPLQFQAFFVDIWTRYPPSGFHPNRNLLTLTLHPRHPAPSTATTSPKRYSLVIRVVPLAAPCPTALPPCVHLPALGGPEAVGLRDPGLWAPQGPLAGLVTGALGTQPETITPDNVDDGSIATSMGLTVPTPPHEDDQPADAMTATPDGPTPGLADPLAYEHYALLDQERVYGRVVSLVEVTTGEV